MPRNFKYFLYVLHTSSRQMQGVLNSIFFIMIVFVQWLHSIRHCMYNVYRYETDKIIGFEHLVKFFILWLCDSLRVYAAICNLDDIFDNETMCVDFLFFSKFPALSICRSIVINCDKFD